MVSDFASDMSSPFFHFLQKLVEKFIRVAGTLISRKSSLIRVGDDAVAEYDKV